MKKYKFTKPYSETVTVGGVVGVRTFKYNTGDVIEGVISTEPQNGKTKVTYMPEGNIYLGIPIEYLVEEGASTASGAKNVPANKYLTPLNIGVAVGGLIVVLAVLKWKKVI